MYSRVPAGRARRLTDTSETPSTAKEHAHPVLGGIASSGVRADGSDMLSVISCFGGGIEGNRSITLGPLRMTYSVHTAPGADPDGSVKDNQDAWAVKERLGPLDTALFGVFDGHGQQGKAVSHHVCAMLPRLVSRSALCKANRTLRHASIDCDLSGSTGVVALVTAGGKLVVANLGDSRCVAGRVDPRSGKVVAVALTSDHTPLDQAEADRVLASGGRIASYMLGNEPLGPPRVWLRDLNVPGLCMTRSFGDAVAATVGVIDSPEVVVHPLRPEDRYVVLMSDGIFEFKDNQEVLEAVHALATRGAGPNEAAKHLVKEARRRWQQEEQDIIDDCTAIVIYVSHRPPSGGGSGSGAAASAGAGGLGAGLGLGSGGVAAGGDRLAGRLESALRLSGAERHHAAHPALSNGGRGASSHRLTTSGSGSGSGSGGVSGSGSGSGNGSSGSGSASANTSGSGALRASGSGSGALRPSASGGAHGKAGAGGFGYARR